jgi:phosphoribosyl 1,2-cyclic phosphodiesterase
VVVGWRYFHLRSSQFYSVIFDSGTGLVAVGEEIQARARVAPARVLLLVSHVHHDHTMGWPFFKPLYDPSAIIHVRGPESDGRAFQDLFEGSFAHPYFPVSPAAMPSKRSFGTLRHGDVVTWASPDESPSSGASSAENPGALVVRAFRNRNHPNGGVLNYRLERSGRSVVIATDVEGTEGETGDLIDFARDADVLVHDAQYTDEEYETATRGWGHSTWRMAADVARRSNAHRLVLYHHDPAHDDRAVESIERLTREKFPRSIAACEGLEISI